MKIKKKQLKKFLAGKFGIYHDLKEDIYLIEGDHILDPGEYVFIYRNEGGQVLCFENDWVGALKEYVPVKMLSEIIKVEKEEIPELDEETQAVKRAWCKTLCFLKKQNLEPDQIREINTITKFLKEKYEN